MLKSSIIHIYSHVDYYVSVVLYAILGYFLAGVFWHYGLTLLLWYMALYLAYKERFFSRPVFGLCVLTGISIILIAPHHFIHGLVMIVMFGVYLLNKNVKTLWPQNIFLIGLFLLLMQKPGVFLIVFGNYYRFTSWLYAMLVGG